MALAMARPWKHPKTGIYWLRKRVPNDLRPLLGKREEKASLGTREPDEAKLLHVQALAELEQRWANLRAPPKPISEREAHELVAPAYEWWIDLHRDNPSEQEVWKTKFFDGLWKYREHPIYDGLPVLEQLRRMEEDGHVAMSNMEQFCRERVEELLRSRGLRVDWQSREKIQKAFGAAIQRASLDLAKLATGEFASLPNCQPAMSIVQPRPNTVRASEPVTFEIPNGWMGGRKTANAENPLCIQSFSGKSGRLFGS